MKGDLATFGEQRYIALSNGFTQNYTKEGSGGLTENIATVLNPLTI